MLPIEISINEPICDSTLFIIDERFPGFGSVLSRKSSVKSFVPYYNKQFGIEIGGKTFSILQ